MSFSLSSFIPAPSFVQAVEKKIEPLNFPECPGVYVMVNHKDQLIYTGKATSLRLRMQQHANSSHNPEVAKKIAEGNIKEIKVFCCQTELDAIVLERYFIQSDLYRGKYNIQYTRKDQNGELRDIEDELEEDFPYEIEETEQGRKILATNEIADAFTMLQRSIDHQKINSEQILEELDGNRNDFKDLKEYIDILADGVISLQKKVNKPKKKRILHLLTKRP